MMSSSCGTCRGRAVPRAIRPGGSTRAAVADCARTWAAVALAGVLALGMWSGPGIAQTAVSTAGTGLFDFLKAPSPASESAWIEGFHNKVRLVRGAVTEPRRDLRDTRLTLGDPLAAIEIVMDDGFKTYWRTPGDAGGMAPFFDFSASKNVAEARVLFPAPRRLVDEFGSAIGYKRRVMLPIVVRALDKTRPIELRVAMHYGVCLDICIPVDATLALTLPAMAKGSSPHQPALEAALNAVPRRITEVDAQGSGSVDLQKSAAAPVALLSNSAVFTGPAPELTVTVAVARELAGQADLFLEAADGTFVPMAKPVRRTSGDAKTGNANAKAGGNAMVRMTFASDLTKTYDVDGLRGAKLWATVTTAAGAFELAISNRTATQ